ncbi:MAG: tRNA uridine-5-carboxymethylaminomethyl(34) synthesis GTPase MnmE, partial [Lachnoclostridium sp.]|nr:tRNA uridine-5-carboxymethylaminomethyl(34) synthesis GTPase MnmE [Lachnoclostridium sp.]
LENADFVIIVFDQSTKIDDNDIQILKLTNGYKGIVLLNKSDIPAKTTKKDIEQYTDKKISSISIINNEGLEELENYLKKCFYADELSYNDEIYITNTRQKAVLIEAIESLEKVIEGIDIGISEDFLSIDLSDARESLGKIIGETVEEDVIEMIFREFCVGK